MRILLLILVVATATFGHHQDCTPDCFFRNECNNCRCTLDGKSSYCTQRICPPGFFNADGSLRVPLSIIHQIIPDVTEIEIIPAGKIGEVQALYVKVCTPNSFFHIGCNKCKCSGFGEKYNCTKEDCAKHHINHVPYHSHDHHRSVRSANEAECEPGTTSYEYCNVCHCSENGMIECTDKDCDKNVFNKNGTLKHPYCDIITPIF